MLPAIIQMTNENRAEQLSNQKPILEPTSKTQARIAFADQVWGNMLQLYSIDGIPGLCLSLQDEEGVDVPLLLMLVLADHAGHGATELELKRLDDSGDFWRETVILPLRTMRIGLRNYVDDLTTMRFREEVKKFEIAAESQHVTRLADVFGQMDGPSELTRRYLTMRGLTLNHINSAAERLSAAASQAHQVLAKHPRNGLRKNGRF